MAANLDNIPTTQLQAELAKREREAAQAFEAAVRARNEALAQALTPELVNVLAPEHGRSSCSDTNIENGFRSGKRVPRCTRCALLEALSTRSIWANVRLAVHFELTGIED